MEKVYCTFNRNQSYTNRYVQLTSGDLFKIPTKIGFGLLQFIEIDSMGIEYIRVLDFLSENGIISQFEIEKTEKWSIGFPLRAASPKKIVERIARFYKTGNLSRIIFVF